MSAHSEELCPVCGANPCRLLGGTIAEDERDVNVDDWREIYRLWLAFLRDTHKVIYQARQRKQAGPHA